jgi:hypothetical protein
VVAAHWAVAGGIARLAALIEQHGEAVEADLAFRGIDLRDLWRGDLTWRRLAVLVAALPPESATKAAARDALSPAQLAALPTRSGHGPWSHTELLLAAIVDRLSMLLWQNGGKASAPRPEPIPRPGVESNHQRTLSTAAVTYLADRRERRRAALAAERK